MKEQNFEKHTQQEPVDVEQRLRAYFGPALPEQPLSSASWQRLSHQLGPQEGARQRRRIPRLPRIAWRLPQKRARANVPTALQDAFARIAYKARIAYTPAMLRCSLISPVREPAVRSSWLGRRTIRLFLPINAMISMGQDELDVLVATGIARSIAARKPKYMSGRLLLAGMALLACLVLILSWMHHVLLVGLPLAMVLCALSVWFWQRQTRSIAFHADTLMVRWLGRSRACSGLHALANRSRAPRRRRWGEPSLLERIERVCGTRVEARDHELTLVG
jgi:hypothetical protein